MTLKPGVAYCFRAFYPMISDMVEGSWSHFVRRLNTDVLGTTTDLRTFLFGSDRAALARYRPILEDVQEGRCLYCERGLGGSVEVDHFIPWRRYPTDLGHNFVLAHGGVTPGRETGWRPRSIWRGGGEGTRSIGGCWGSGLIGRGCCMIGRLRCRWLGGLMGRWNVPAGRSGWSGRC